MKTIILSLVAVSLVLSGCACKDKACSKNTFKMASEIDPQNLDPRFARDLNSVNLLHILFDGLFRKDKEGKVALAICSSYEVYDGGRSYRFRLREAKWSNGDQVKASDFAHAWMSILDPKSTSSYAYQFYSIEGAKAYKEGYGSKQAVKIFAENDKLLVVQLEHPSSNFVDLLTSHPFLPVNQKVDLANHYWSNDSDFFVSNGPYQLKNWEKQHLISLEKNPSYWQKDRVQIEEIEVHVMNNETALNLFENKELDWVGAPLGGIPLDSLSALSSQLIVNDCAGTFFLRLNVTRTLLKDKDFRHALSLGIDRQSIVDRVVKGRQKEALGLVPTFFDLKTPQGTTFDPVLARSMIEGMRDRIGDNPQISIMYSNSETFHRICQVIQQNWKENLGIDVQLKPQEWKSFSHLVQSKEYDIAIGSWFADIFDPSDFLEVFKESNASTNNTGWENSTYQALLNLSSIELDQVTRREILSQAQEILIDEMPIIPMYHATFLHLENGDVKGVTLSPLGHLDFVDAQ